MRIFLIAVLFVFRFTDANAQYVYKAIIQDKNSGESLDGVSVKIKELTQKGALSTPNGAVVLKNITTQHITILFSLVGYKDQEQLVQFPDSSTHIILMETDAKTLNDVVVVSATRNNDRIENSTIKVEVLGLEEMNEESTLKPGNIASILGDVSGVQIQQSSAVSGNANVRIQGLDGRYTQILRDGMPLYGGYAGGFGVLSIPPLDLRQVELIKGSSSTLYGGGAIGGLVNLVSKKPSYTPDASFLVNQTTLNETNINAYYAQRWKKVGFTLFAGQTFQKEMDIDKDGFSDLPDTKSTLIHPTLFFYPSAKTYVSLGWSGSFESRLGGDMIAVAGKADGNHPYFEKNKLDRNLFSVIAETKLPHSLTLSIKGSFSIFNREETTNTYLFNGKQNNYYTEASLVKKANRHTIVAGINITGDQFKPSAATPVPVGTFANNIAGLFLQDTWQLLEKTKLETGLRFDHHDQYGNFFLPRIALFHRINGHWGTRLGFDMGYITPNPLTPQIKDYSIYQLQPIGANASAERSYAGNVEINYKKEFGEDRSFFINSAFFITQVNDPVTATEDGMGNVSFSNQSKPVLTKGFDTYIQLHIPLWEFYVGYTYTDALRRYLPSNQFMPITPRNRAAATIMYEIEDKWRIGVEASYNGFQYREDHSKTPDYVFMAAMAERKFGSRWSLVLNCENLFDERQSNYESLYTGSVANPSFRTLWAPIDGRVFNLCIRFKPFEKAH